MDGSPAAHYWPEKSADHGSQRLLPLASPIGRRCPNHTYRPHPHIMGEHSYARWHFTCRGQEIWYNRHRLNVLHYTRYYIFTQKPRCFCTLLYYRSAIPLYLRLNPSTSHPLLLPCAGIVSSLSHRHHVISLSSCCHHVSLSCRSLVVVSSSSRRRLVVVSLSSRRRLVIVSSSSVVASSSRTTLIAFGGRF